ncbi:MAG TPA: twin-arginine translocase TatA/TatE family subunit [Anaerolineales bacterium]|nr:twin-arginine translocase TatA/TatE family subunit [Anaerolineales bacterium]
MEILGIGPLELIFILLIALIILGPGDMVKAGRTLGRFLRKVVSSSEWRTVQKASRELRYLPNRLMREANMEDLSKDLADINKIGGQLKSDIKKVDADLSSWTTPPEPTSNSPTQPETDASTSHEDTSDVAAPPSSTT